MKIFFKPIHIIILILSTLQSSSIFAQIDGYFGAGHELGVQVTASSSVGNSTPDKTLNGSGMNAALMDVSRFAGQTTFGADLATIQDIQSMGYETWIDSQFTKKYDLMLPKMYEIWSDVLTYDSLAYGPYALHFNYAWWQNNMTNQDLLRQRVAYALSQILVTSINSDLGAWGESVSSYYDIFVRNAFGNYRDILSEVTRHPAMGYYLSHLNNPPEILENNIHPDENYAREIMQLFTIGLFELNPDGTRKLDDNGNAIPTYTNTDIKQLARVFTGMSGGKTLDMMYCPTQPEFGLNIYCLDKTEPMIMFGYAHQTGSKVFLNHTISGQNSYTDTEAMDEVQEAIDVLFNHPNTGPFVATRLIQRFVTSNPSPGYVGRVAAAFANNGQGVRGDMKAIMKAILLDEEARSVEAYHNPLSGKFREPMIRHTHLMRALPKVSLSGKFYNNGYDLLNAYGQHVMASPTVFNFYAPDYAPIGDITNLDLVAPEFKLHNTTTSINYLNANFALLFWTGPDPVNQGSIVNSWDIPIKAWFDTKRLQDISYDSETLINELDKIFTHGQLSDETRVIMREGLNKLNWTWDNSSPYYKTNLAIYMILISPDYTCTK